MDREEKLACLRLIRTPNIGPMTFSLLLQRYGSAIEALRAVPKLAKRGGRSLKPAGRALAEAELQANEDAGASLLFKGAGDYPARLARPAAATLPDPADWRQARLAPGKPEEIDRCRSAILAGLGPEGTDIDEVIRWCGMPASTVLAAILELEIAGRLTRHHGNRICLVVIR